MEETIAELRRQLEEERQAREEERKAREEAERRVQPNTLFRLLDHCLHGGGFCFSPYPEG